MPKYNTLAELQRNHGGEADDDGQTQENWQTDGRAWGLLTQLSSSEELIGEQKKTFALFSFETHYQRNLPLDSTWRLKIGPRLLYLASAPNDVDNRHHTWIITVQERT